ncbi:MAG: hypothetical protein BJ554DRAFT_6015 [Olpidium bornovanus]|uniref:Uncharacterized protein n=1 Tax=Olpidium bornovanus TaxID=278681 RepID=A0A8H8A293_9FUNG|nr:MAG: hypothetical protein BJ554DRAFT_6015 [Olpidium bornovanus]
MKRSPGHVLGVSAESARFVQIAPRFEADGTNSKPGGNLAYPSLSHKAPLGYKAQPVGGFDRGCNVLLPWPFAAHDNGDTTTAAASSEFAGFAEFAGFRRDSQGSRGKPRRLAVVRGAGPATTSPGRGAYRRRRPRGKGLRPGKGAAGRAGRGTSESNPAGPEPLRRNKFGQQKRFFFFLFFFFFSGNPFP